MAEVGSPAMAEMQPQRPATRLQDRLGKWARETFTPTGRAEVMAQKQIDTILSQVPPEKRAEAMALLEAKRPDLVDSNLPGAKDRLVKEAVVGAAALGVLAVGGTVAYVKRDALVNAAFSIGIPTVKGDNRSLAAKDRLAGVRRANFVASIRRATDPVRGFIDGMRNRINPSRGEMPINLGKMFKDIEDKALDALNIKYPVLKMGVEINDTLRDAVESKLANDFERELAGNFLKLAKRHGEWVPFIIEKLTDVVDGGPRLNKNYDTMINRGFANKKVLGDGTVIIAPTQAFVGFVKKHLVS